MRIDYKKELETAAKSMILVREPNVLIKMIARTIVQKVKVSHIGILLNDKTKNTYVLTVSRGKLGLKIPAGFARIDMDNPLIRFFTEGRNKEIFGNGALIYDEIKKRLRQNIKNGNKKFLKKVLYQMEIFGATVCISSYFGNELLAIFLFGPKKNGKKFAREELDFFIALASDVAMAIRNAQLFRDLQLELDKKHRLFIHTTIALATAIDAKDHYTHGHTERVTNLSLEIAKKLVQNNKKEFDQKFLEQIHIAALLHDIGKIGIPESILNKSGSLTEAEMRRMQEHTLLGTKILEPINELQDAILGVKYHHERYDGSGYPEGLKGKQIPFIASVIAVADTFDAIITDRPYRQKLTKDEAVEEIKRMCGKQFDPRVTDAFIELFHEGKI